MLKIEDKEFNPNYLLWLEAIKQPVTVQACQMFTYFTLDTDEGCAFGHPGDFLIKGELGELNICGQEIYRQTYTPPEGMFWCEACDKLRAIDDFNFEDGVELCDACIAELREE